MLKIALICENGASTGLCAQKMIGAAETLGIEPDIAAYSINQIDSLADKMDVLLIGPQLSYRLENLKKTYPQQARKFAAIDPMDFGMMNGEKILRTAMTLADKNK